MVDHGQESRYYYGCRCQPCTMAHMRGEKRRKLARARGYNRMVDAVPVNRHVKDLERYGFGRAVLYKVAGVPNNASDRTRMHALNAAKLMALTFESVIQAMPDNSKLGIVGARRRLQALIRIGHNRDSIPLSRAMISNVLNKDTTQVTAGTWRAVAAAYDRVSMTLGPGGRSASMAEKKRWAPPLAWDDDTIDDPACRPAFSRRAA